MILCGNKDTFKGHSLELDVYEGQVTVYMVVMRIFAKPAVV